MMGRRTQDPLDHARERAEQATNLFTAAHQELEESNTILDETLDSHTSEIQLLRQRIDVANRQKEQNARVQEKLRAFIP